MESSRLSIKMDVRSHAEKVDDMESVIAARLGDWRCSDEVSDFHVGASFSDRICPVPETTDTKDPSERLGFIEEGDRLESTRKGQAASVGGPRDGPGQSSRYYRRDPGGRTDPVKPQPLLQQKFLAEALRKESGNVLRAASKTRLWDSVWTVALDNERYAKPPVRQPNKPSRVAVTPSVSATYENVATLVAETREEIQDFVKGAKKERKRMDWFSYRGPMIPRKILLGLRAKQKERERKKKDLARAAGVLRTSLPKRRR